MTIDDLLNYPYYSLMKRDNQIAFMWYSEKEKKWSIVVDTTIEGLLQQMEGKWTKGSY